jgi:hypothetical protein
MGESFMKTLTLVVCSAMFLAACGSAGTGSTENLTMQAGQWEYAVVPDNNSTPMFIDVNQPGTNASFSASNAVIFNSAQVGLPGADAPIYCGDFNFNGTVTNSAVKGSMSWGTPSVHFANFSGTVAPNGQAISKGSYSGHLCTDRTSPVSSGPEVNGSFTGYTISPINGTFTGTLNSSLYGADVVTLSITQNSDFSLNVAGTFTENGVTSIFVPSTTPTDNSVTGATVYINGTSKNVNTSQILSLNGHLNPSATQITISFMSVGPDEIITGSLTKQ